MADSVALAASLAWNRDDALQDMLMCKAFRQVISWPVHHVPTAEGFGAAVRAALGWGMYPEQLAAAALHNGSFVRIADVYLCAPVPAVLEARQPAHLTSLISIRTLTVLV
jgi:LysR family transcriptional regulator, chromosome initiation inhibitor